MIVRFRHKGLERLFTEGSAALITAQYARRITLILAQLNVARTPETMNMPGLKFHSLRGDLAGFYAVSVSANWRIVFRFESANATDVDLIDYH